MSKNKSSWDKWKKNSRSVSSGRPRAGEEGPTYDPKTGKWSDGFDSHLVASGSAPYHFDRGQQKWIEAESAVTYTRTFAPKPFEWWETGLPQVVAGRQLLDLGDAPRLVQETQATHVLDLRKPSEWKPPNRGLKAIEALKLLGVERLNVPVTDGTSPGPQDYEQAVAFIREGVAAGGVVYVHCRAGKERTAAVLLAYAGKEWPELLADSWDRLRETCKLFDPTFNQAKSVLRWLDVQGLLPCCQCGLPLPVDPRIGRITCRKCEDAYLLRTYNDWQLGGKVRETAENGQLTLLPTRDERGRFAAAPPFDVEDLGVQLCPSCLEEPAQGVYGFCLTCQNELGIGSSADGE